MTEAVTILIVEDDQLIQGMVEEALSDGGFKSVITGSGEELFHSRRVLRLKLGASRCNRASTAHW